MEMVIKNTLIKAKTNPFFRHNLIYFLGSFGVSVLNYLYYPILGRLMAPAQFGEVQTIISFFLQAAIFLQVLGLLSIGVINRYENEAERQRLLTEFSRLAFQIAVVLFVVTVVAAPALKVYFQFGSAAPFVALGLSLLVSVPLAFANSFLQAHRRFGALARSNLIGAGAKLVFGVALVTIGWQSFGAIFGLVLAQTLALIYAIRRGTSGLAILKSNLAIKRPNLRIMKPELPYAGLALAATLTVNVLLSLDVLAVKHLFSPEQAGLYSGISTIGRIIFYVTGMLAVVLFPHIKPGREHTASNHQYLLRSLALCSCLGLGSLIIFTIAPHLVIRILIGAKYLHYASLLPRLGLALFLLSVGNLLMYYCVAARHYSAAAIAPGSLILGLVLVSQFHASIGAIITDITIAGATLAGLLAIRIITERKGEMAA